MVRLGGTALLLELIAILLKSKTSTPQRDSDPHTPRCKPGGCADHPINTLEDPLARTLPDVNGSPTPASGIRWAKTVGFAGLLTSLTDSGGGSTADWDF